MNQRNSIIKNSLLIFSVLFLFAGRSFSQVKKDTVKINKPPFTASIGPYTTGPAMADDLRRLMSLNPLIKVKDAKGTEYKVVSYEITWKKKEQSDDVKTGKPKTVFYMVGADINNNQLPENWREDITNGVKTGEEIMLSNILYLDPKKKTNYKAPSIVLSIL